MDSSSTSPSKQPRPNQPSIQINALKVHPPTRDLSGKEKQDLVVAGCVKLILWQEQVGKFETNH